MSAVIICGPKGCGKTLHGKALARHYNKTQVIDLGVDCRDAEAATRHFPANALVLTNEPIRGAIPFRDAMRAAGLFK